MNKVERKETRETLDGLLQLLVKADPVYMYKHHMDCKPKDCPVARGYRLRRKIL